MKEKGVEVVRADFNDLKSLEVAFKGAHGVFGVTNCAYLYAFSYAFDVNSYNADWDPAVFNEEKEFVQGKLLVDAAKTAGVKHFVYSCVLS